MNTLHMIGNFNAKGWHEQTCLSVSHVNGLKICVHQKPIAKNGGQSAHLLLV